MKILNFILIVFLTPVTFAADYSAEKEEIQSRKSALTSKATHRRLSRAHTLMGKDKVSDAIGVLKKLEASTKGRPNELAQVLQTLGYAYAQKEQYKSAFKALQQSLNLKVLPYNATLSTIYTMAQVKLATEDYKGAGKIMDHWFGLAEEPSADAYMVKATIASQTGNKKKALQLVTKAIDMSDAPKESWMAFAVAMNYEMKKYVEAARILVKLTGKYPEKKKYWQQLSGVYLNIDKNDKALATLELAYKANYLDKEAEIMNLVSLFIYQSIPLKAAKLLGATIKSGKVKKTRKHYEILGDAWASAEEMDKALGAFNTAAKYASSGQIAAKTGRIYLEKEDWKNAASKFKEGLNKGKLRKASHVHMALGIAQFNLKQFKSALGSFGKAKKSDKKLSRQADQWIAHVKSESGMDAEPQAAVQ